MEYSGPFALRNVMTNIGARTEEKEQAAEPCVPAPEASQQAFLERVRQGTHSEATWSLSLASQTCLGSVRVAAD